MPRNVQIALFVMSLALAGSLFYFFNVARTIRSSTLPEAEPVFSEADLPLYQPNDPSIDVKLFLPATSNDVLLRTRDVTIFATTRVEDRARQLVEHLIAGIGEEGLYGRLPEGTRLNQVFVSEDGTAYLDFNSALSDNHPGGVLPEQASIYSIVNSLSYNVPEIERVKILIGGVEKETLAGHCLLLLPLPADLSITDIAETVESG